MRKKESLIRNIRIDVEGRTEKRLRKEEERREREERNGLKKWYGKKRAEEGDKGKNGGKLNRKRLVIGKNKGTERKKIKKMKMRKLEKENLIMNEWMNE